MQETPHASHLDMEGRHCPWHNQCQAAQAVWDRCELSTPWHDSKKVEPAHSCRRRAKPFLLSNWACLLNPLWKPSWLGAVHSMRAARLARTQCCSRSLNLAPNSIGNEPYQATSRVAPWVDLRQNPPFNPDIVPSETKKSDEELCGIWLRTVLHPLAYNNSLPLCSPPGEEKLPSLSGPHRISR